MTVFHFSTFFANAISGPLVDLRGKEKYSNFQAYSLLIGGIAMVLMSISSTIYSLFISVAMIGVCISLWHPAAITYLSVNYPENRGFVLSIHSIGASLGDALSPLLATFFLTYVTINEVIYLGTQPQYSYLYRFFYISADNYFLFER